MANPKRIARLIFILIGIIFFLSAFAFSKLNYILLSNISIEMGAVVFGVIVLETLWSSIGGDPQAEREGKLFGAIQLLKGANSIGLEAVYINSMFMEPDAVLLQLKQARKKIDLCGLSLYEVFLNKREYLETLEDRVRNGVHVRILIPASENDALLGNYLDERTVKMQTEKVWESLVALFESLSDEEKPRLELFRLKSGVITISIRRSDSFMSVMHYLSYVSSMITPIYVFDGKSQSAFKIYISEFEEKLRRSAKYEA